MSSNQKPEQSLWENVHQASKIYILPNSFTAGNLFFGFLSIILCVQGRFNADSTDRTIDHIAALITPNYTAGASAPSTGYYVLAIICILASFLCDALDGRVARASGKTSLFGKEFDSIADSVSFGIAPCLLMFFLILQPSAMLSDTWIRLLRNTGWLIGFIFMLCAAIRLARFNVLTNPYINGHEKYEKGDFSGLPAPAAAGAVASIALSNFPYPSFKHINWTTSMRFRSFVALIICIILIVALRECSFAIIFLAYVFYPPIKYIPRALKIFSYLRRQRGKGAKKAAR